MPSNVQKSRMGILEVIKDMNSMGDVKTAFTEGYCYDFAYMLQRTFGGEIVYTNDHYLLKVGNKFYDITGEVKAPETFEIDT